MPKVYITRRIPESALQRLRESFGPEHVGQYELDQASPRDVLLEGVQGCEAIFAILTEHIDAEVLDAAGPDLQIVANMAVGYDNIDVDACTERGIVVTNTPDVLTESTADLAFALMLAAARRMSEAERVLRSGEWPGWGPLQFLGADLYGKQLGIYGMGRIGQALAERAAGFNMRIIYHTPRPLPPRREAELTAWYASRETLLTRSDFISIHCPLNEQTHHAFGAKEFKQMRANAVLVNTARGPVVDEAALADALKSGEIAAAGLDVYEEEPKVHPALLECPNAVLLPHIGSATEATRGKMAGLAADNIIAKLNGQRPGNLVNPEALERART